MEKKSSPLSTDRDENPYNKSHQDALFLNFILVNNSTCFGQIYCPSSGVLILYSQQEVRIELVGFYCKNIS
jgi:hypothetical protein